MIKNKENVPSFGETRKKFGEILEVQTINGFVFQQMSRPTKQSSILILLGCSPVEYEQIMTKVGPRLLLLHKTQVLSILSSFKTKRTKTLIQIGSLRNLLKFKAWPIDSIKIQTKIFSNSQFFGVSFMKPFMNMKAMINVKNDFKTIINKSICGMVGTPFLSFGLTVNKNIDEPFSFLYQLNRKVDNTNFQFNVIDLNNGAPLQHVFQWRKKLNENWNAGFSYYINSALSSYLTMCWKAKVGKCLVHSGFNTNGVVKTKFTCQVTEQFRFGMSAFLSHTEKKYRFGTFLLWEQPKEKK